MVSTTLLLKSGSDHIALDDFGGAGSPIVDVSRKRLYFQSHFSRLGLLREKRLKIFTNFALRHNNADYGNSNATHLFVSVTA